MIKHVNFVSVPVADQKRALEFYTKRLGFTVFTDQPFGEDMRWIELKIGGAQTKLVLFTSEDYKDMIGKSVAFTLGVDDIDRTYAELREKGVEFESPPKKESWGSYVTMLDSEGNKLLLSQN